MSETRLSKGYTNFIVLLLLLFPIFINSVKILGNFIILLLCILGAYIAISEKKNPLQLKELRVFSWLTIGYFSVMLLSGLIADGIDYEFHHLGRKLHFLLAPLIGLAILQANIPLNRLLSSIKVGLIVIGIITTIQWLSGHHRPSGMINANIFGDIAVAMLFLSIVQIFTEPTKEKILSFLAVIFGITAIVLSDSRGSWLSLVILSITYIGLIYQPFLQNNKQRKVLLSVFLLIFIGFIGTQTNIDKRIGIAITEVQKWHSGDNINDSNGLRLQMWQAGIMAAKESPWLGYGYRNANKIAAEYALDHKSTIRNKTHLHNEYITNLVSAGIVGLLALLALLFVPMALFYRKLNEKASYPYALMGVLLCVGYATFGFTHIAFGEEHINAFYIFFMGFLFSNITPISTN